MSRLGIHFPNAGFRNLDALWSIPWESFVVLHLNRDWVPEIRLRFPKATILVRAYLKNWTIKDPVAWASEITQWANELRPFNIEITFANEQNLATEGHPLAARPGMDYPPASVYQDILEWDTAVIQELRAHLPWATIHFPALSQGHSDDQRDAAYIGFEILREAVEMCDVLDAHTYWDEQEPARRVDVRFGERYRLLHALFPDKHIFISEFGARVPESNQDGHGIAKWLEALPGYVGGACWFIWDSDVVNQSWILRDKPPMVEAIRSYQLAAAAQEDSASIVNPIDIAMALVMGSTAFSPTTFATTGGEQTIGYDHVIRDGDGPGQPISEPEARQLLRDDLDLSLQALEKLATVILTVNQKAALLSLIHDVGIDELWGSALLERLNAADVFGAAFELKHWRSDGDNLPAAVRQRQIESELFLRDVIPSVPSTTAFPMPPKPLAPLPCTISATATWVSVKQGERYQVIGVWYHEAASPAIPTGKGESDPSGGGHLFVRVEDESGVGILAELVILRRARSQADWEPALSDASGVVWFNLNEGSRFDPRRGSGPERIQIGDCAVNGLGLPSYGTVGAAPSAYVIRVKKTT